MTDLAQYVRVKSNRLLARISLKTGIILNKPTYICAKMTMRCNSHCVHCNIWNKEFGENELTANEWYRILDELRAWLGSFNMVFTGGEALLRSDMIDILTYAVKKGIRCELLSNSILVDDSLAKDIVNSGISQFTTSFDGIKAETHDRFRGKAGFHARTVAAITALCAYRKGERRPIDILLKTVINASNLSELSAIAQFSKKMGVRVLYQPIEQNYAEAPNASWYKQSPLWIHDIKKLKVEMVKLQDLKRQGYPIGNSISDLLTIIRYFEYPDEMMTAVQNHDTRNTVDTCGAAVGSFVISSNGDVRMCFRMEPIGNLRLLSPGEVWKKRNRCWVSGCNFR